MRSTLRVITIMRKSYIARPTLQYLIFNAALIPVSMHSPSIPTRTKLRHPNASKSITPALVAQEQTE